MKMLSKIMYVFAVLMLFLVGSFPLGVKADTDDIRFISVQINGQYVLFKDRPSVTQEHINVQARDTLDISVGYVNDGNEAIDDIRVSARILGYEFGTLVADSEIDNVEAGQTYYENLRLVIPEDIDASEEYTLLIEIASPTDIISHEILLDIDEQRHDVDFFPGGIVITPAERIMAGRPLFVEVTVENLGEKKEENVQVIAEIKELGVSASGFVRELIPRLEEDRQRFDDDEESSDSVSLLLRPAEDAKTGQYTLQVTLLYNRGHDVVTTTRPIFIQGVETEVPGDQTIVNIDSQSKQAKPGEEVAYKLSIANLGTERALYTVSVDGVSFGEVRVDPSFINVNGDSSAEVRVYIKPFENAEAKDHMFVIRVMQDREIVSEIPGSLMISGEKAPIGTTFKNALAMIFVVLVIVLIVLGVVVAFRKMKENEDEPSAVTEGQTYYYTPRN